MSDKTTHACVVDVEGKVLRRYVVASDPGVRARWLSQHSPELHRVVLETGPLSTFLYHGLVGCICARHAKGVLSARVNKSDVHDAAGLGQLARTGWYKRVHTKGSATHIDRAALRIRSQLITARTSLAYQLRLLINRRRTDNRAHLDLHDRGPSPFCRKRGCRAYAGLVPRRSQPREHDVSGHISKAGDPMLRKALYKAAKVALTQVKRQLALQRWGRKMAKAKCARRARTAVACKLAALLHSLWLNETEFRWA